MQRRRVLGFNQPINPLMGGKAGSKDPRSFVSGNEPGQQWDEEQFAIDRQSLARFPPPQYSEVQSRHSGGTGGFATQTVPTRVTFIPWTLDGAHPVTTANIPFLLVPKNPRRVSFQFSASSFSFPNTDIDIAHFSWGKPPQNGSVPFGNLLGPGQVLKYDSGSCPIDEFWVWSSTITGNFYCAFEGIEAPEGNL